MKGIILFLFAISLFANQKISILLDWKYQFEFAGYIAAKEKGFYKEAGVDVNLVEYNNQNIINDVLNGKYQFGIFNNHLIEAKINGKPVKLVSSIFKRSALVIVTKPYIKNLKDLEYKKIMASKDDYSTLTFLQDHGVNLDTIDFVKQTFTIDPFVNNKIDAMTAFITNEIYLLDKKHVKFNIINPSDYNFLMYQGEFFTSNKFATQNPVLVDKIKKATIKGWKYALKHKNEIIDIILKKYNTQHKSKDAYIYEAKEIEKIIEPYIYPIGYINKPLLKAQFGYEAKKLHKNIDIDKELDEYIFDFKNPLNLSKDYLPLIQLYNIYVDNKAVVIISFIFLMILIIIIYFYLKLKKARDILHKQIYKTKRAMKVKEEFLANMSHEIRTPLNAMLGFIDIVHENEQNPKNKEYLEIVKSSGKTLLTIINDILDFSKIESGKLKLEIIEFNPKKEFKQLFMLFENKAQKKGVNLHIHLENLNYYIKSDPIRLKQVVANLLNNAIKFTPSGKNIYCSVIYYSQSEQLYVEIKDEGIGIEKNKIKDVFEAFTQEDSSTTRKYGGTGLGLTISKQLITLLKGNLEISSQKNKGTKISFRIPAKKGEFIKSEKVIKKYLKIKFEDIKVLMVEDNQANQMFFKVLLNALGIKHIDLASDGIEAIKKASDEYDIIFMDENMPNMNGLEASKKIKEKGIKTPIIAVTANALSGDKEKFLQIMDGYLSKPVEKEKLIEILHKYIKEKND